jgi:ADP-heptose:LPS heptosyltransferase
MQIKNRNLFRITRLILLKLPGLFKLFSKFRAGKNRLLIIKTDAIGDYILFRNYLEILRQSATFKDHTITLLGNELWKDIALKYDSTFVDDFLFIKPDSLYEAPLQALKLGWRLFKNNYGIVLQPSSTRLFITDGLAGLTAAKQIIGFESDTEGIALKYKVYTDKFYTHKLILPQNIYFEFDRSRFFFESVLNCSISINQPSIPHDKTGKSGIVIFVGAGIFKRGWEAEKFLALIKLIRLHISQIIYLAGSPDEIPTGNYLTENLPANSINNLIGKTTLLQLIELVANAALVIANETSAVHIAAAAQTKAICILGGGHFGRFAPYPENYISKPLCIYEKMECYNCNWRCKFQTMENQPFPCISGVSIEKAWQATLKALPAIQAK